MTDRAIPNLPARDVDATIAFYGGFGFIVTYRSDEWLILRRGDLQLEFFPAPDVGPLSSSFMCTVRVADLDALHAAIAATGILQADSGHPRLSSIELRPWGLRAAYLVDLDGTQVSLVEDAA